MVEKNIAGRRRRPNNQTQSSKTSSFDKAKCLLPTKISALQFVEKCQKSRQEKICINVTQSFFRMKMFFSSLHFSFQFKLISCVVQYLNVVHLIVVYRYIFQYIHTHIYCMYIIIQKLGIGKHPSSVACNFLTVPCQKIACENVQKT